MPISCIFTGMETKMAGVQPRRSSAAEDFPGQIRRRNNLCAALSRYTGAIKFFVGFGAEDLLWRTSLVNI